MPDFVDKARKEYEQHFNRAMQQAATTLGIEIIWGGNWKVKDGPHFELA